MILSTGLIIAIVGFALAQLLVACACFQWSKSMRRRRNGFHPPITRTFPGYNLHEEPQRPPRCRGGRENDRQLRRPGPVRIHRPVMKPPIPPPPPSNPPAYEQPPSYSSVVLDVEQHL